MFAVLLVYKKKKELCDVCGGDLGLFFSIFEQVCNKAACRLGVCIKQKRENGIMSVLK